MKEKKFLVIREFLTAGMCACLMHVVNGLLCAKLSNRIPIVYWGKGSSYYEASEYLAGIVPNNVFENYFEPISEYSIEDVLGKGYAYFPSYWTDSTIVDGKFPKSDPLRYDLNFRSNKANVLVSFLMQRIEDLQSLIPPNSELSGLSRDELWHHFYSKNLRLKENVKERIDKFYDENMRDGHIIGVHVRKTDKKSEQVSPYTSRYLRAAETLLSSNIDAKLFVATDCEKTLDRFVGRFKERVIFTNSIRSTDSSALHTSAGNKLIKGEQILMDVYLLSRCKHYIGSLATSISFVVLFMLSDPAASRSRSTIIGPSFLERAEWNLTKYLPKKTKWFFRRLKGKFKASYNHL